MARSSAVTSPPIADALEDSSFCPEHTCPMVEKKCRGWDSRCDEETNESQNKFEIDSGEFVVTVASRKYVMEGVPTWIGTELVSF